jgi:hypothetical protein
MNLEPRPPGRLAAPSAPRDKLSGLSGHPDATPEHYELAYDEARRALDAQESVVNELRTRAGILIAAAAITTSFFGGRALSDGDVATAGWIAIACFGVVGASVLAVLWPRTDWTFTVNAQRFIGTYVESDDGPLPLPVIHRDLALHMSASYVANARQLRVLTIAFRVGAVFLVGEVVAWVVGIGDDG